MSPPQDTGLVHSVQARLQNEARERNRPFAELLELYAVERFLHRLGSSPHRDLFVLKGALLLRQWLGAETRPTRDIDLLGPIDLGQEQLRDLLGDLLRLVVEDDGITFVIESIDVLPIRAESSVLGWRAKFDAHLGRTKLRYQVDIGLGDAVFPRTVELVPGGLLGMPMASVRAYTPYTSVAEKLEAMVQLGNANSRTKDYYDLSQLPRALAFEGPILVESIQRTFARRATLIPPGPLEGLSDAFATDPLHAGRWRAFIEKNQLVVTEVELVAVVGNIRHFAQPVLDAARNKQAFHRHWPCGGPWGEEGASSDD